MYVYKVRWLCKFWGAIFYSLLASNAQLGVAFPVSNRSKLHTALGDLKQHCFSDRVVGRDDDNDSAHVNSSQV